MLNSGDSILGRRAGRRRENRLRPVVLALIPLAAILFQVYLPQFSRYLAYLELPLLVTVYYAFSRRSPIAGLLIGAGIGLAQDSLSHNPLGVFGIVKTLVGYLAASAGRRFDVDNRMVRFVLVFASFFFHQLLYSIIATAMLSQQAGLDLLQTIVLAFLNAAVAVPLFHCLDQV